MLFRSKNKGAAEATNISWNISVDCDSLICGRITSGVINSIPAGGMIKVDSKIILGFGSTQFTVNGGEPYGSKDFRKQGGKLYLFYVKVNPGGGDLS